MAQLHVTERELFLLRDSFAETQNGAKIAFVPSMLHASEHKLADNMTPLLTEETLELLKLKGAKYLAPLACQYGRPIALGKLSFELLPSGEFPGGANLFLMNGTRTLLYAPRLCAYRTRLSRELMLRPAQVLILGADHPEPRARHTNRKKELEKAIEFAVDNLGIGGLVCTSISGALELAKHLGERGIPTALHAQIYRFASYLSRCGTLPPLVSKLPTSGQALRRDAVPIFPAQIKRPQDYQILADWKLALIRNTPDHDNSLVELYLSKNIELTCEVPFSPSGSQFNEIIRVVKPEKLFFTGPYAQRYAQSFSSSAKLVGALPSSSMGLF